MPSAPGTAGAPPPAITVAQGACPVAIATAATRWQQHVGPERGGGRGGGRGLPGGSAGSGASGQGGEGKRDITAYGGFDTVGPMGRSRSAVSVGMVDAKGGAELFWLEPIFFTSHPLFPPLSQEGRKGSVCWDLRGELLQSPPACSAWSKAGAPLSKRGFL